MAAKYYWSRVGASTRMVQAHTTDEAFEKCERVWPRENIRVSNDFSETPSGSFIMDSWDDQTGVWMIHAGMNHRIYLSYRGHSGDRRHNIITGANSKDHSTLYSDRKGAFEHFDKMMVPNHEYSVEISKTTDIPICGHPWSVMFMAGAFYYCFQSEAAVMEYRLTS